MPNLPIKILLFLSSYFPLTLIFAVQYYLKSQHTWAYVSVGIGALGLIGIIVYLLTVRRLNPTILKVDSVERRDFEAMSYIVTYLLPFIAIPVSDPGSTIGLIIFLIVLCVLYINSGMIHINPTLNLVGLHVYEIKLHEGDTVSVLARGKLKRGSTISVVKMGDGIYKEVKAK